MLTIALCVFVFILVGWVFWYAATPSAAVTVAKAVEQDAVKLAEDASQAVKSEVAAAKTYVGPKTGSAKP